MNEDMILYFFERVANNGLKMLEASCQRIAVSWLRRWQATKNFAARALYSKLRHGGSTGLAIVSEMLVAYPWAVAWVVVGKDCEHTNSLCAQRLPATVTWP
jgi:hypothetical protein